MTDSTQNLISHILYHEVIAVILISTEFWQKNWCENIVALKNGKPNFTIKIQTSHLMQNLICNILCHKITSLAPILAPLRPKNRFENAISVSGYDNIAYPNTLIAFSDTLIAFFAKIRVFKTRFGKLLMTAPVFSFSNSNYRK